MASIKLDEIQLPQLSYLVLTLVVIYIGQILENLLAKNKREKITSYERDLYFQKLTEESYKMEEKALEEERKLTEVVEELRSQNQELKSQLRNCNDNDEYDNDEDEGSDWSADELNLNLDENFEKEVESYQQEKKELQSAEENIKDLSKNVVVDESIDLRERIKELETENEELKAQISANNSTPQLVSKTTELDPKILSYLEEHKDELTLEFLEKAHETFLEIKASNPDKNFDEYIDELKKGQSVYVTELAELRVSKKEVEIKLQLLKRQFEEELSSFNELRIEHLFKNSGAKEYLERLKDKNKVKDDIIASMKKELEAKKNEANLWESKFLDAEKQCSVYWQAWKDTQVRKEQLEAEKRASQERDRRIQLNQSINLSSASSLVEAQVPPPPPIDIPSVDEILRVNRNQAANPYTVNLNASIPPPPPVEVPFNEIFKHSRSGYN